MSPGWRVAARVFEETPVHDRPSASVSERERLARTLALIPPNTQSILDVGSGAGELLRRCQVPFAVGLDLARRGLRNLRVPKAQASMLALPFPDASFDVVVCSEALEHLDPSVVPAAARELRRVARRSVLVTVPWAEDLEQYSHRCPACRATFHLHGHLGTFSEEDLRRLFADAKETHIRGAWRSRPFSHTLLTFRTRRLDLWKYSAHTVCPHCGNQAIANHEHRLLYRVVEWANTLVHPRKSVWRWLLFRADYT